MGYASLHEEEPRSVNIPSARSEIAEFKQTTDHNRTRLMAKFERATRWCVVLQTRCRKERNLELHHGNRILSRVLFENHRVATPTKRIQSCKRVAHAQFTTYVCFCPCATCSRLWPPASCVGTQSVHENKCTAQACRHLLSVRISTPRHAKS